MSRPIIEVKNVSKHYRLGAIGATSLREEFHRTWDRLRGRHSADPREFWALRDVSFEVHPGEVVGIIGRNGAGKSTLLKILSRITEPTSGKAILRGRVASLLEVGTGFHPELSGRDNIFLNGAILGMRRAEVQRKFDEIVAFAEVEQFIDTPVKRYSSGMYVRLAFAVAAHLEPEILIIDEVLAVGDAAFQKKCLGKMNDVAEHGRTVIFVSHHMGIISTLTSRCVYLHAGRVIASGDSHTIVEQYLAKSAEPKIREEKDLKFYRREINPESPVRIIGIGLGENALASDPVRTVNLGSPLTIEIALDVAKPLHGSVVVVILKNFMGERVSVLVSWDQSFRIFADCGTQKLAVHVRDLPLAPGRYYVDVGINRSVETKAYDVILDFPLFTVVNRGEVTHWLDRPWGLLHPRDVEWEVIASSRV